MTSGGDPDEPSPRDEIVRELTGAAKARAGEAVNYAVSTVTFIVLVALMVPIGIVTLVASVLLASVLGSVIDVPAGPLRSVAGVAWMGLTLAALVLIWHKLFRRLPRGVREHAVPGLRRRTEAPAESSDATPSPNTPTLAELDARLAPPHDRAG